LEEGEEKGKGGKRAREEERKGGVGKRRERER